MCQSSSNTNEEETNTDWRGSMLCVELNAATALRKLRLTLERTLIRSEANAPNATTANEEQIKLRKRLRETERGDEREGGW